MDSAANASSPGPGFVIALMAVVVLMIASMWRIFSKAGAPGWKALIPVYGAVVFQRIVGRPGWWALLMFVPVVNVLISLVECFDLARVYGKGAGYAIGLILLGPIFFMALAFGSAVYEGPNRPATASFPSRPGTPPMRKAA
jgi:hypothetical protein